MIKDKKGRIVRVGDTLAFPYIDPMGKICEDLPDFEATVVFKHGCMGYEGKIGLYLSSDGVK